MVEVNVEWNIKSNRILFIVCQRLRHSPKWDGISNKPIIFRLTICYTQCDIDFTLDFSFFTVVVSFAEIRRISLKFALQLVEGCIDDECWFLLTISNLCHIDFSSIFDLLPKLVLIIANVIESSFLCLMLSVSCSARDTSVSCALLSHGRLFGLCESVKACIVLWENKIYSIYHRKLFEY